MLSIIVAYGQLRGFHLPAEKTSGKIRFRSSHNLIIIPVTVNGVEMSFILDTGSTHTLLFGTKQSNPELFKQTRKVQIAGIGTEKYVTGFEAAGMNVRIGKAVNPDMKLYIISPDDFDIFRMTGENIHGIIGYDLFRDLIVTIHYSKRYIRLTNPEKFNPPGRKYKPIPIEIRQNKPYLKAKILQMLGDTLPVDMLIDTGNSDAIWLFENDKISPEKGKEYFEDFLGEGISGSITGKRSRLRSLQFDGFVFPNPTVSYLDSTMTRFTRLDSLRSGSLGAQIWQRFISIIDYPHRKIYLKKIRSFNDEFRYNRSGIHLIYAGKTLVSTRRLLPKKSNLPATAQDTFELKVEYEYEFKPLYMVQYIRPGSPAGISGLQPGDVLVSVNGKEAYHYSISQLNEMFHGKDGKRIRMTVKRKSQKIHLAFKLKKIL